MTFGISGAAIAGLAVGAAGIGSSIIAGKSSKKAANAQQESAALAVEEQKRQFDKLQELLKPFVDSGSKSLTSQQDLIGVNGSDAQKAAIDNIKSSYQYDELNRQGQDAILQNASATGGLRGGNVQGALAQFSPALLNSMIEGQYNKFSGLTTMGANAAAGVGNAGMQSANSISDLLQQSGAAKAGGYLAQGNAMQSGLNSIVQGLGVYRGLGGGF